MLVVGLTGGIAAGKSTALAYLHSRAVCLVDADVIAREVVEPGTATYAQLRRAFGAEFFDDDGGGGALRRERLGELIFRDADKRRLLNSITHPAIRKRIAWRVLRALLAGERYVIVDLPLLFESRLERFLSRVIVVHCSDEQQMRRLCARDNLSREQAAARISAQLPTAYKLQRASCAIDNSGAVEGLNRQLGAYIDELEQSWQPLIVRLVASSLLLISALFAYRLFV